LLGGSGVPIEKAGLVYLGSLADAFLIDVGELILTGLLDSRFTAGGERLAGGYR
jgi:hypothetical protein